MHNNIKMTCKRYSVTNKILLAQLMTREIVLLITICHSLKSLNFNRIKCTTVFSVILRNFVKNCPSWFYCIKILTRALSSIT